MTVQLLTLYTDPERHYTDGLAGDIVMQYDRLKNKLYQNVIREEKRTGCSVISVTCPPRDGATVHGHKYLRRCLAKVFLEIV